MSQLQVLGPVAGRIPIFISNSPVILALGLAVTITVILIRSNRKAEAATSQRADAARHVSDIERLLGDPRYVEAMRTMVEARDETGDEALERGVAHLVRNGVMATTARRNLLRIIQAMRSQ